MSQQQKLANKGKSVKLSYDRTFESDHGREVLFDLMDSCNFTGSSLIDSNSYEPIAMAFRDGQKSIVSRILETLNTDNTKFIEMLKQKHREEEDIFDE